MNGTAYFATGGHNELAAMVGSGTTYDITPLSMTTGREDAGLNLGFGGGFYGTGYFGTQRPTGTYSTTSWQLDNFGQYLVVFIMMLALVEWQLDRQQLYLSQMLH